MVQFKFKKYEDGGLTEGETAYTSFNAAKASLESLFMYDDNAASFEERKMASGHMSISIKDAGNKIMYQLTTVNPIIQ